MNEITLETPRESPRLQGKEITKTASDLLGQEWLRPGFKSDKVSVSRTPDREGDVWRSDFAVDKNTLVSFGFQVKQIEEEGVVRDEIKEVRFRVGSSRPIISLTEQGFKRHQKVDDKGEALTEADQQQALENWRTIKNSLIALKQEMAEETRKAAKSKGALKKRFARATGAVMIATLPLFACDVEPQALRSTEEIGQVEPTTSEQTRFSKTKEPIKELQAPSPISFPQPLIETATPLVKPTEPTKVAELEPSFYEAKIIEDTKVYGLGFNKVNTENDLARLLTYLDQEFEKSGEELNSNHRHLEIFVLQSVWDKFESEKKGEMARFIKDHINYLNNLPVGNEKELTNQTLKNSDLEIELRRIVILPDGEFKNWSPIKRSYPDWFHPTRDANARFMINSDFRMESAFYVNNRDYGFIHELVHLGLGFIPHTSFTIDGNIQAFREIKNPDGTPIPQTSKIQNNHSYDTPEARGIMGFNYGEESYLEDFVLAACRRMNELGLRTTGWRNQWWTQEAFFQEVPQQTFLRLKGDSGNVIPSGNRVYFYKSEKRIDQGSNGEQVPVPVFAEKSKTEEVVRKDGKVIFPQSFLTEAVPEENRISPMNKNFFLIVENKPGEFLYQHLTIMPFMMGFWHGNKERFEMEVMVMRPY